METEFTLFNIIIPLITFVLGCLFTIIYDYYKEKQTKKGYFFKNIYEPLALIYRKYGVLGEHESSFWNLKKDDQEQFIELVRKGMTYSHCNKKLDSILSECLRAYDNPSEISKMFSEGIEGGFGISPFWDLEDYVTKKLNHESKKYK